MDVNVNIQSIQRDDIDIIVQINDPPSKHVSVSLNPGEKLSKIRERLEQNSRIRMNDTISFANKVVQINNNNVENFLAEVAKEDEKKKTLEKIIDKNDNILYLKSEPDWKFLKDKLRLEYGFTSMLEKANKKAFTIMEGCKMTEIVDGCKHNTIEIDLEEDQIMKNEFLLAAETNMLRTTYGSSKIEKSNCKTNLTCAISEYSKASLEFRLQPDSEFIKEVKDAIESKDPRNFKKITEKFGQFIPTEIILGGRAYFKSSNISRDRSEENSNKFEVNTGGTVGQTPNIRIESNTENLSRNINNSKRECFKLIGGQQLSINNFDEKDWVESLKDFRNWSCIKFKNSINIFQPLPENLRKQILLSVGKKILHTNTEDFTYYLSECAKPKVFMLNIPENISKIIQNKESDCSIFAAVTDKKKEDIYNCQVVWSQNEDPRLVIHCIQKKFKERKCKLNISWMIIGYDLNFDFSRSEFNTHLEVQKHCFNASAGHQTVIKPLDLEYDSSVLCFGIPILNKLNSLNDSIAINHHFFNDQKSGKIGLYAFSYCLEKNHYVDLPDFTFTVLIISTYPNSDNCGILPIKHNNKIKNLLNFIRNNPLKQKPKFLSLYSIGENCGPKFLKQKINRIKVKSVDIKCNQEDCICKNEKLEKSENNLKYAFLNPIEANAVKGNSLTC
ncbi:hypothetical protein RclHR1_03130006 [Rhizophagus clarus]|uniref:MACPF domain-containing protein n=1 Tax=Rhizophagus clarus TaxID=94130 RepID=A0A2Z6R7A6_9GLOM|nr:hypothetical protein RclHR1_03130006 [Rhizophagus clarus]GES81821.1 hypothetical protein GLOIN_2v1487729 [Rhizophagus clarus]